MKINTLLLKFGLMLVTFAALVLSGCSKDEGIDNRDHGYGNLQFRLYKKGTTRASNELEYLRDASKIQVNFLYNGRNFNQTLILSYSDEESAEYGLRSETVKLASGDYQILSFTIYNNLEQMLVTEKLAKPIDLSLADSHLTMQDLEVAATLRGKVYFRLTKVLPDMSRVSRDEYTFDEITKANITIVDKDNLAMQFNNLKGTFKRDLVNGTSFVVCDTLWIPAGTYKFKEIRLFDTSGNDLEFIQNPTGEGYTNVVIKDVTETPLAPVDVPITIKKTAKYIQDYLALRDIWEALEGENWSYIGQNYPIGANWNFSGDVDLWGDQPGVNLHNNGRVAGLDLGGFDPHGKVPAAIGKLSELTLLSLGTHNDAYPDNAVPEFDIHGNPINSGSYSRHYTGKNRNNSGTEYDVWACVMKGQMPGVNIRERAGREMKARNAFGKAAKYSSDLFSSMRKNGLIKPLGTEDLTTYVDIDYGYITNHITGIDDAIKNCTKLESLSVANSHVSELPAGLAGMQNLTSVELYNNPLMKKFPIVIAQLPALYQTILANNTQWNAITIRDGVNALFDGREGGPTKKIQVIYLNNNNLEEIPVNLKNGKMIGFLDLGNNKIRNNTENKLNPLTLDVAPTQLYLDNNLLEGQPFPENFCKTDDMELFSCTENRITVFPNIFTSKTQYIIKSVDFSGNRIVSIEGDDAQWDDKGNITKHATFKGISAETVSLNYNRLKGGIPAAFASSNPKSLISNLTLKGNDLDSMGWQGLKGMESLVALELEANRISVTSKHPNFFLGKECPYLTGISLNFNSFTKFPTDLFNGYSINQFYFEGQTIDGRRSYRDWPTGIETYNQLKVLKMAGNDIRKVQAFPSGLNYLTIEDNPNLSIAIPDDVCARIVSGMFFFTYDKSQQFITGCPELGIGDETNN